MIDVAVQIASIRNSDKTIASVQAAKISKYSYKIYLYAQTPPSDPTVEFIQETERRGAMTAYNTLAQLAPPAEFVVTLADGWCVTPNFFDIIDELIARRQTHKIAVVGIGHATGPISIHSSIPFQTAMIRTPCFTQESLDRDFEKHVFNPYFNYHVGDHWIGAWSHLMGEPSYESGNVLTSYCNYHDYNNAKDEADVLILQALCRNFENNRSYIANPYAI